MQFRPKLAAAGPRAIGWSGLRACGEGEADATTRNVGAVSGVGDRNDNDPDAGIDVDADTDEDPSALCMAARVASIDRPTTAFGP